MRSSASHTLSWNGVPRRSSARRGRAEGSKRGAATVAMASGSSEKVARGQRRRMSWRAPSWSPSTAKARPQRPRGETSASASPKGDSTQPWRIETPSPPRRYSPGDRVSWARKRSWSRPGPERPASAEASSTPRLASRHALARSSERNWTKRLGLTPAHRVNSRWKCGALRPTRAAVSSREGCSWARSTRNSMARSIRA